MFHSFQFFQWSYLQMVVHKRCIYLFKLAQQNHLSIYFLYFVETKFMTIFSFQE